MRVGLSTTAIFGDLSNYIFGNFSLALRLYESCCYCKTFKRYLMLSVAYANSLRFHATVESHWHDVTKRTLEHWRWSPIKLTITSITPGYELTISLVNHCAVAQSRLTVLGRLYVLASPNSTILKKCESRKLHIIKLNINYISPRRQQHKHANSRQRENIT